MRIRDKRSYLVCANLSGNAPTTLYLIDTTGKTVRSIRVPSQSIVSVTVPVGQTVEIASLDGQKPSATVNGAEATTAIAPGGIGHGGYILTSHPLAGDIVMFRK